MNVLSISNLAVQAWGASLLHDINLDVRSGDISAIIGPNGAGKTTLLRAILGDVERRSGSIAISGRSMDDWPVSELAKHLAVLPQQSLLNFPYTVAEVIALGRIPHSSGNDIDRAIANEISALLDIDHLQERLYTRLSGGEKQRVQLARVMAQIWRAEDAGQRLLLLDEPTTALDLGHQKQLMDVVRSFSERGVAVLMVVHDIDLVAHYATHVTALSCGRAIAQGAVEDVICDNVMEALFSVKVSVIPHPITGKPVVLRV